MESTLFWQLTIKSLPIHRFWILFEHFDGYVHGTVDFSLTEIAIRIINQVRCRPELLFTIIKRMIPGSVKIFPRISYVLIYMPIERTK